MAPRLTMSFVVLASFISTALTMANAFFLKKQFYPSVVYLTKSSTSMAVIYFQAAVISYLVFTFMRWIFFGQLRAAEVEHAQERVWHAIMETCLAFTVFRDDFSPRFVVQFVVLFFVKAFHWLAEDRVDYMERSPVITVLFHARILGILSLLSAVDSYFISHAFFTTLMRGASAQIVFGFEYAVLMTMVVHISINYILHMHDLRSPHPWENKAVYMLYAELFTSFLRCLLYLAFAVVMIKIHTFPLFAIRPFYLTVRALRKAINDVILSRRAINAMNNLFPLATAQELAESDNTCIICREEMTVESGAKKLPCNHIFHPNCLRSWFQRQQTCPTCRTDVLANRRPNIVPGQAAANNQQAQPQPGQQPLNPQQQLFNFFGAPQFQQQPQRPPNAAAAGGGNFVFGAAGPGNFFAGFPMPPPMPPQFFQQPAQQQPQPGTPAGDQQNANNAQAGDAPPTASTSQGSAQQGPPPPSMPPFFPNTFMPPFGFFPPPPFPPSSVPFPPPPSFSGLTDSEVAELEGNERRAVEARVEVLRNIATLLDAAMLQFQQYLSVANMPSAAFSPPQAGPSTSAASTSTEPTSSRQEEQPQPNAETAGTS